METIFYFESEVYHYKRFVIFTYDSYYPSGGLEDASVSFDELAEAIEYLNKNDYEHVSLFDCKAQKEIDITKYGLKY